MNGKRRLGDYKEIEFVGGQPTKRIECAEKDSVLDKISTIPTKAITNGRLEKEFLYDLEYKVEFDSSKLTQEGDVVLKLSSTYDATYITKEDEGLLVTSFCLILRVKDKTKLNPRFLNAFVNSDIYREQIKEMLSGAKVPMLTIEKVKDVFIKEFTMEEQEEIAGYYDNMRRHETIVNKIIELQKENLNVVLGGQCDECTSVL